MQELSKSDKKLKKFLGPTFTLELKAHRIKEKYKHEIHEFADNIRLKKNDIFKMSDVDFLSQNLSVNMDIEVVEMNWHPAFKIYNFTINKRYISTNEDFVVIKYNPQKENIDEFIVNEMTALTINLFKDEPSVKIVMEKMCRLIGDENLSEIKSLIIGKIKALIEIDWLIIK